MDSSHYNPTYGSYTSHHLTPGHLLPPPPPPPLPPPPSHILQSHSESPNFCGRSNQSGFHRPNYYVFSDRHDFQPEVAVSSQPSSYYSQHPSTLQQLHLPYIPEKVGYDSPMSSQPSFFPSTESEDITRSVWVGYKERGPDSWTMDAGRGRVETDCGDIAQPVWVGYNENRPEAWTVDGGPDRMDVARGRVDAGPNRIDDVRGQVDVGPGRNYQFDYDRSSRVCSGFSSNCGLDNTSRSRDEFESIGCVRKESGAARIEGNYEDRGHLRLESDRYIRGLGEGIRGFSSSAGYGNERYGGTANLDMTRSPTTHDGAGNQRWVEAPNRGRAPFSRKRHDCHHSEVDRYFDNVRREHSSELDLMPKKQIQKKSVLLRLEAPRVKPNGRENRSRHPGHYSGKRVSSSVAVTPRSSKARREMVTNKTERDSVTEGNGKFVTHASYEASASEGSRQFTRKSTVSKIEKKPDSHLSPSSSPNGVKLHKVKVVDGFGQDCKLKITDAGPEALTCVSEAKVCSTAHAADKISSYCEASKEPNDDSNMKLCSTREDTTDGCKSKLKSYEDVLDNKGTDTLMDEALMGKVTEIEEILNMKIKVNTSLVTSPVSWQKSADIKTLSVCSEGGIPFAATSMCSGGSQPCEEKDMDGIPSRNLQMMEVNVGPQETNSISSSIRTLSYGEKDLVDKSSLDATIFSISEDTGDHVLAKSSMSDVGDDIKDANKGNTKYVDSLSYEVDPSSGLPKGLVSSASLDGVSFSKDLANATNSVSGDLANANSYTGEACTTTKVNTPDRSVVFQEESKVFSDSQVNGNSVNPLVDNVSMKEFMETEPLNYSAETDEILDIEEEAYVNSISSSPTKFTGNGSSNALDEGLGLSSHHSAEIPFVDQFSDSDNRGLKGCFSEANASLCKYITDDTNESTICDKFPRSSGFVIETNLAIGNSETSCSERVTDTESGFLETQPSSGECKFVSQDRFGFGSSGEVGSVWNPSMGNNPENHLRTGSCLVPDSSAGTCHISPTVPVSEQIQNTTSNKASCCDSQGDIMPKENNSAESENIEVRSPEEKINPSDLTSKFSLGPDNVAVNGDSVLPCNSLPGSPRLSFGQIRSETLVAVVVDKPNKDKESDDEDALLDPLEEQIMTSHEVTQQGQTSTNTDVDSCVHPMPIDSGGDRVEKCNADPIEKVTDVTSDVGSHVKYSPSCVKTDMCDGEVLSSDGKIYATEVARDSGVHVSRLHSHTDVKSSLTHVKDPVVSVPPRESQSKTSLNFRCEMQKGKKKANYATQKCYPRSLPSASDTKKGGNPPTNITNRLTWHRKSATSASPLVAVKPLSTQQKFPKVTTQSSSSSYVRKGNSLLRKPSHSSPGISSGMPPSSIKLNRITVEDKSMGSVGRIGVDNTIFAVKAGERLTQQSRSASGSSSKISNVVASSSGKCALSSSNDHLTTGLPESIMDSATSGEAIVPHSGGDAIKTSDTLHHTGYVSDCQQKKNPPKLDSSTFRKMVYVKKKANQLVAASGIHGASKSQIPPTDSYYKRSVNQLVRNSESHVDQAISLRDDSSDSQTAAKMVSERSSISAFGNSAVVRPFKQSKFSRVWKQSDPQSGIPIVHMRYQKILPQLVPWKRVTYWRRLMNVSNVRNGSFSNISRKLLMMRKRHTVYTRSSNGYSLRKSKVLSIGGSHLKWSKSIERDSRKANEEATLAVAAFAKKTSEKHCGQSNTGTNRNHLARERIFRIGSLRYKMDSSRRTLQRISDVGSPCAGSSENGKGTKKPFIPKRLVIGNEEYVRVGNGNQLVRDPKKRTRVLANEKVRWSLHNVRLRLAKKKKYCQFFTRFGKCNKDDGKCPYIHDPSKIAVCTKFLNGLCVNANCKLTHKVIPERMPDCSYFLQGLCNNGACPYRHVHVNPNAAICDEFLKGYCSDGDECRKKHTYTCPVFEATGSCPKGSKCKLHHPKKQSKGKKRKRASEPSQKNARGRYFGSLHKDFSESEPMVLDRRAIDNDVFGFQGLEFIKLDSTEYQASNETDDQTATEQLISSDGEVSIEDLIRPVLLMQQEVL